MRSVSFERGSGQQFERPVEMVGSQIAAAVLRPAANAAINSAQNERDISNAYIDSLKPEDYVPYVINQPGLSSLIADTADQRQAIFGQYVRENETARQYGDAVTAAAQAAKDKAAASSSVGDGLDWVRDIMGRPNGARNYSAPIALNQQTQQYEANWLGAVLYPLGVLQNTVMGAALDGRLLLRQLGNALPPQHRADADKFLRNSPLLRDNAIVNFVLNKNKYDDGKSNTLEAIRGAQYSFSDDQGEGLGIGLQPTRTNVSVRGAGPTAVSVPGKLRTPAVGFGPMGFVLPGVALPDNFTIRGVPFLNNVDVNPSKLVGFAADVALGFKVDKLLSVAAKKLGIGARTYNKASQQLTAAATPPRPQLMLPPGRSLPTGNGVPVGGALARTRALVTPPGASRTLVVPIATPRLLSPAQQLPTVLPVPRRPFRAVEQLQGTPPRPMLMPSRQTELTALGKLPEASVRKPLDVLKPLDVGPSESLRSRVEDLVSKMDDIFNDPDNAALLKKYDFQAEPIADKLAAVNDYITKEVIKRPNKLIKAMSTETSPIVRVIKEHLTNPSWWDEPGGVRLAEQLETLITAKPKALTKALTNAGVDVDELLVTIRGAVPEQEAGSIIREAQQALPKLDPVLDAANEATVAQHLKDGIKGKLDEVVELQDETVDMGRRTVDPELLPSPVDVAADAAVATKLPTRAIANQKAYHGTRVENLDIAAIDPTIGGARNELGTGVYTYGNKADALRPAKADVAANLPDVEGRTFGDGVIHQVELNGNVIDGAAELPQIKQLAVDAAPSTLRDIVAASPSNSIVGILDHVSANASEEAALTFQRMFAKMLRLKDVQHINVGGITSTIDTKGVLTVGVTPAKGAGANIPHETMLRNRLKMEQQAADITGSQFLRSVTADTAVAAESQALHAANEALQAAQQKTYKAVVESKLLQDAPPPVHTPAPRTGAAPQQVSDVASRYIKGGVQQSGDDYIQGIIDGSVFPKRGEQFSTLVGDILDGYVTAPALIAKLEGKYAKLYDQVADKMYAAKYVDVLPASVKPVASALDDVMAEIATYPPDKVPAELQQKLDELLDAIDDEAFDRKFDESLKGDTPPANNADNPSSPCE
jgi:hypothetical protein